MPGIIASTNNSSYEITISNNSLAKTGKIAASVVRGRRAFIVTDSNVAVHYLSPVTDSLEKHGFSTGSRILPPGESTKSSEMLFDLYAAFHEFSMTRSDLIVALGGGVIGDLTGFAAATYLRGIPLIQIPTTLLAQVDSSVGGKTAIDTPFGKNLVGAFYQPSAVIIDPSVLRTLPRSTMNDGMAEVIKNGCIKDAMMFDSIETGLLNLEFIIERCVRIKTSVVANDERDKGERMLLNFGHTVGHAIEKVTGYSRYTHGQAVAMGMMAACRMGEKLGVTKPGTSVRVRSLLEKFSLPVKIDLSADEIRHAIRSDKKTLSDTIYFVLLREIGEGILYPMSPAALNEVLEEVLHDA